MTASSRTTRLPFVAIVVVPLVFVLLFGWPGFLAHQTYYQETVTLAEPACGNSTGPYSNFSFHGVVFSFRYTYWCGGPVVINGTGTEPSGLVYHFALGNAPGPSNWVSWTAPDGKFGIQWDRVATVNLIVEA